MVLNLGILLEIYEMFYLLRKKVDPLKKGPQIMSKPLTAFLVSRFQFLYYRKKDNES